MVISTSTLVKIAAIGGIVTVTMGFAARYKLNERIAATPYYKSALKTLRTHQGAVQLLGEPIKDCNLEVADTKHNFTKELNAQYEVPVKGTKQKAIMYFWAERKSTEEDWYVKRIELGLRNEPTKRLLVLKEYNKIID